MLRRRFHLDSSAAERKRQRREEKRISGGEKKGGEKKKKEKEKERRRKSSRAVERGVPPRSKGTNCVQDETCARVTDTIHGSRGGGEGGGTQTKKGRKERAKIEHRSPEEERVRDRLVYRR